MTLGEIGWDLGDWAAARRRLPPGDRRHVGITFAYVELKRAEVALADADHEAARASLDRVADLVMGSREPQFIGLAGSLRGRARAPRRRSRRRPRRRRRRPRRDRVLLRGPRRGSRACRRPAPGSRPTPRSAPATSATPRPRREAISRAEGFVMRAEACAADGRPVEAARLASARAHLARARGAADPDARRRRGRGVAGARAPVPGGDRGAAARGDARVARRPRGRRRPAHRRARRREPARGRLAARRGRGPGRPRAAADAVRRRRAPPRSCPTAA